MLFVLLLQVRIDEKITFEGTRDGALEHLEVKGLMQLFIRSHSCPLCASVFF